MAKPIPWAPPMMAVFMPTTRPAASASGPPELPGLMAASVWMTFSIRRPLSPLMERPRALTTPAVTLRWKPKGLPMATTSCPTTRFPASPSVAAVGSSSGVKRTTARSLGGSSPKTSAGTGDPPESVTSMPSERPPRAPALLRPRTTWALVTAVAVPPSVPSTTPLPPPRPSPSPTEMTAGSSLSVTSRTAREYASSASCSERELMERFSKMSTRYFYRIQNQTDPDERLGFGGETSRLKKLLLPDIIPFCERPPRQRASLGSDPGRPGGQDREPDPQDGWGLDGAGGRRAARGPRGAREALGAAAFGLGGDHGHQRQDHHDAHDPQDLADRRRARREQFDGGEPGDRRDRGPPFRRRPRRQARLRDGPLRGGRGERPEGGSRGEARDPGGPEPVPRPARPLR